MKSQYTKWLGTTTLGLFLAAAATVGMTNSIYAQNQPAAAATAAPAAEAAEAAPASEVKLSKEAEKQVNAALDKFKKSDVQGALEALKAVYQANPQMRPPRLVLASWFTQLKNQRAVRLSLEMATEETPNDPEAYVILGNIALAQGEFTAADLLFTKAESLVPGYTANPERAKQLKRQYLNGKLSVADARKRWDDVQAILAALIEIDGQTAELSRKTGISFFQKKEDESARQWLLHAEKLSEGKGMPADAILAQLYLQRGDNDKAKASLDAALAANPNKPEVLILSVAMALNQNNLDLAWKHAQTLNSKNPDNIAAVKTYGNIALYREDYAAAEKAFDGAVKKAPNDLEAANGLALALCEQKDPAKQKKAVELATANAQKQPRNRDLLATLGWTLFKSGDDAKAKQVLQQAAASGQVTSATAFYFASVLNKEGKKDEAKKLLTAALASKTPFMKQKAAKALSDSLGK